MKLADFKAATCLKNSCWRDGGFTDGGVTVDLGANWRLLMLDEHCQDKHGCVGSRGRRGEHCDAVGIHQDDSNRQVRIIEAKRDAKVSSKAKRQLQNGADYVDRAVGTTPVTFSAELHTLPGPAITVQPRSSITIESRKLRVPIYIHHV